MKRDLFACSLFLGIVLCVLLTGCAEPIVTAAPKTAETPSFTPEPTAAPTSVPTSTPTPTPTPEPTPVYVTIGAVGDIMAPETILNSAWYDGGRQDHNFDKMFALMRPLCESVDLMCGNLETAMAGEDVKYSNGNVGRKTYTFNAPDALARDLQKIGFDVLTTANNHCCDRYVEGIVSTAARLREMGFVQTGTYLDEADRQKPCIVEINGIRIGIVTGTLSVNLHKIRMTPELLKVHVSMMMNRDYSLTDEMLAEIRRVREAGADFVIGFMHWDAEGAGPTLSVTKKQAKQLMEAGVDCILASHPHQVRECEYITVTREDGEHTGLVVYSMGNFLCSAGTEEAINLFVRLTLMRDVDGTVSLSRAEYMPTVCCAHQEEGNRIYQIVPAFCDTSLLDTRFGTITKGLQNGIDYARRLCDGKFKIDQVLEKMDETCLIN